MRRFLLALALVLAPLTASVAEEPPKVDYEPARKIVTDAQAIVTPNGVQEAFNAPIGGIDQRISVRGADRRNPIILFIHGGPGSPEMPMSWSFQRPWEEYFTVVQWDQRAAGKTYAANPVPDPATLTPQRYVDDAIELIELLKARYGKQKIIVVGHSWGTVVGLSVAIQRPDLVQAYVGIGQIIDFRENERLGYDWTLAQARAAKNDKAIKDLEALAPYPGPGPLTIERVGVEREWNIHFGGLMAGRDNADAYFRTLRISPDYVDSDRKAFDAGSLLTITRMLPQMTDISFQSVRKVDVPVYFFLGRHDWTTPSSIAEAWLARLKAPAKGATWFENSAHLMPIEEPGKVFVTLLRDVGPKQP
ncbi:pimeloyl-ACP methyl ester carboxylesterase [Caulobacter ginsengisoli]|uniref:Pimeloyl-ACP methyl ester carboxylesterase n=1 Tax=Caulobacter ginsengisoli TaxID=400775 RepID=A0ABU0IPD4_9CAUL|nr:alpha/beta hydrolase [Caulobacter ginsengisoli]MDQ0462827.1 pimeloyl-ACP methyl ester carboxylesterase [Caulobacter ginsengisoli]